MNETRSLQDRILDFIEQHPEVVQDVVSDVAAAGGLDPTLYADAVKAYRAGNWIRFGIRHPAVIEVVLVRLSAHPELALALDSALVKTG